MRKNATAKVKESASKALAAVRDKMIADGAYDGRFRSRTEIDRKKEQSRRACRDW